MIFIEVTPYRKSSDKGSKTVLIAVNNIIAISGDDDGDANIMDTRGKSFSVHESFQEVKQKIAVQCPIV